MFVTVKNDCDYNSSGSAKGNLPVLLAQQICVACGIIQLNCRMAELLVTNISSKHQHQVKQTAIAHIEVIGGAISSALAEPSAAVKGKPQLSVQSV